MDKKIAFSKMRVKAINEEKREIVGIASYISPDRDEDVLVPEGAEFTLPMPLLWMHDHDDPVGEIYEAKVIPGEGIEIKARIVQVEEPPRLRERLNEAWAKLKTGLVRGLSVGFRPIEWSFMENTGGMKFERWDWYETSAVTIPANRDATLAVIKKLSNQNPSTAASGKGKGSGAFTLNSGASAGTQSNNEVNNMYAKQIKQFQDAKKELQAKRKSLMDAAEKENRTLDASEQEEFDQATADISTTDGHIKRLEALMAEDLSQAAPVDGEQTKGGDAAKAAAENRAGQKRIVVSDRTAENGLAFAQYVKMVGLASGNMREAAAIADSFAKQGTIDKRVAHALKAAVPAASTLDPDWAGSLVHQRNVIADFVEFLRPMTIIGQFGTGNIPGLRLVPADTPIDVQTSGGDAYWVGEGKAKPLTSWSYESRTLPEFKLATIAAITKELLKKSTTAADTLIRNELADAIRARMDKDFIDPAKNLAAGISPASITNGASNQASVNAEADINYLFGVLASGQIPLLSGVLIMSSMNAFSLSRLKDPLGNRTYPDLTINGGYIEGLPVIVSDYVGDIVVLAAAREIYLVDEGGMQIDMSDQASLEMADNPAHNSTTPTPAQLVSMWQTNSVAFRAERFINWQRRRPQAVAYVTGANYAAGGSGS